MALGCRAASRYTRVSPAAEHAHASLPAARARTAPGRGTHAGGATSDLAQSSAAPAPAPAQARAVHPLRRPARGTLSPPPPPPPRPTSGARACRPASASAEPAARLRGSVSARRAPGRVPLDHSHAALAESMTRAPKLMNTVCNRRPGVQLQLQTSKTAIVGLARESAGRAHTAERAHHSTRRACRFLSRR